MVMVGWPRPLVTKLLPSHRNRFAMSWVRWKRSMTERRGSFPMRHVPSRCRANVDSAMLPRQTWTAPAAVRISAARSCSQAANFRSSGWAL